MKLLLYSHFFAPSVGGVETLVLSLVRGLTTLRNSSGQPELEITLVTQTPAGNFEDGALPFRVVRQPSFLDLRRLIRASDVVHVAGPALATLILGLLARKRVIVEHHGFQTICPNGQLLIEPAGSPCPGHFMAGHHAMCLRCNVGQGRLTTLKLWLLTFVRRFLCRRVATNVTPTAWLGGLVQLPRTVAIPHGLQLSGNTPPSPTKPSYPPVVAFLGRLVTTKGVRVLLDAARILREQNRDFQLLIIREGPERASLETFAQQTSLAGHVRFTGRLGAEQLEAALSGASVVVVPSLGGEVFGLVVAENMWRGLPVITSDLGAFVEVLGECGLTFPTGNAAELARAIGQIFDDPAFATQIAQRGRQRALEFCDFQRMLESHTRVYRRAGV
jgi:glycogen(starch) synthase